MATTSNDQMDRSFLTASIPELLKKLSVEEKVSLLAGQDWWQTVPIPRLNIPSVKVTDGPNGARGESFYKMCPASALPCATSLAASFSESLSTAAGELLAAEAKARNAVCLLGPTINICRSPLGGRAFESPSEDPTLSGLVAAAYINGLQSKGVSATVKHFTGNDQEHERMGIDSVIDQRTLREVYLRPFQIAQRLSKPWAYMTSYGKLNGTHCSENGWLLQTLLRKEWGFDGLVMSDWYGTYSVSEAINAGLNLEMPGKTRWRQWEHVAHLVGAHKIDPRQVDKVAGEVLSWVQKLAKTNEDLVYAEPTPERTRWDEKDKDAKLLRQIGAESLVLLKNEGDILPLQKGKVAVIGPNAKAAVITGGGSASLRAAWSVTPWQGLEENKPSGIDLSYSLGAFTAKFLPTLDENFSAADGSGRLTVSHYALVDGKQAGSPSVSETWHTSDLFMADFYHPDLRPCWFTEITAVFTSPIDGEYEFGVSCTGIAWIWVDGALVVDNSKDQKMGSSFFGAGTEERKGSVKVQKGKKYNVRMLHDGRRPVVDEVASNPFSIMGVRLGAFQKFNPDQAIEDAVKLASEVDVPVIVAGLNADWESEGYDRPTLSMPLRTDELIERVAAANPKTVVVIQAGSAVSMPWVDKVAGVVYAWYGGNEAGNAIADVIYGKVNPSGRMPITLPKREQDIAASLNFKSARKQSFYGESVWIGYKHHNSRGIPPLFPFGHGLSYTTFEYSDLKITSAPKPGASPDEFSVGVSVTITNTGKIAGSHSAHFYTCPPPDTETGLKHPSHALQAFKKVDNLSPGEKKTVEVTLNKYAVCHWDEVYDTWRAEQGEWVVKVGRDAQTLEGAATFSVDSELEWRGL